ncbi:uncharacterized protein [Diabrotica undecimpunctata]|uniref:uncharacterized protein n=1 Tax=Diabrotica undecimpunctata TaxID=50387 RepID=UPI003B63A7C5
MASRAHSSHRHDIVDRNSSEDEHADFSNGSSDDYHPSSDSDITESDEKNTRGQEEPQDKKRKSDPKKWKKNIRKQKRAAGKEYINTSGTVIHSKSFNDYSCNCKINCQNKLTAQQKESFFNLFYNESQSWETQTSIISGAVKCRTIIRRRKNTDI